MALVLDASAIVSLVLTEEDDIAAQNIIDAVAASMAAVPTLFWFEIRNALVMGERRKRTTVQKSTAFLMELALMPIEIDAQPHEAAVLTYARQQDLTVYDAAYLELAQRRNLPLATADKALIRAAAAIGVTVWQP